MEEPSEQSATVQEAANEASSAESAAPRLSLTPEEIKRLGDTLDPSILALFAIC